MITDLRTYTLHPGRLSEFIRRYQEEGYPLQREHLGNCDGYYVVEVGVQNRVVHLWSHADLAERDRRRKVMQGDERWVAYRKTIAGFFAHQDNQILRPAPFWRPPGKRPDPDGLVDLRMYTIHHGRLGELLELYASTGRAIQERHFGDPVAYYVSDIGTQNQIVHLWAYRDHADRLDRRAAIMADSAWTAYLEKAFPMFAKMENMILRPILI